MAFCGECALEGGGILSAGVLTLTDCTISGNLAGLFWEEEVGDE